MAAVACGRGTACTFDRIISHPRAALVAAGIEYQQRVLSDEQLALYRVVTRDVHNFPELGRRYRKQVIERGHVVFVLLNSRCL